MVMFGLLEHQALNKEWENTTNQYKCTRRGRNYKSGVILTEVIKNNSPICLVHFMYQLSINHRITRVI